MPPWLHFFSLEDSFYWCDPRRGLAVIHRFKKLKTPRPQCTRWPGSSSRGPGPEPHGSGSGLFCCSALLPAGPQCGWLHEPGREEGEKRCLISNVRGTQQLNLRCCFQMFPWIIGGRGNRTQMFESNPPKRQKEKKATNLPPRVLLMQYEMNWVKNFVPILRWWPKWTAKAWPRIVIKSHSHILHFICVCVCVCLWKSPSLL